MSRVKMTDILTKDEIELQMHQQREIMKEVRRLNDEYFETTGRRKKHLCVTWGCQMNSVRCI